jgi:Protein of unknown function (DUF2628)
MAIYAVHSPAADGDPAAAFERAEFLRVGFSAAALIFGPFWLLTKRLWLALAIWILGAAIVGLALASGALNGGTGFVLYVLSAVFLGLEGRALQGEALARNGRPLVEIVGGADSEDAERAFLARALGPRPAPSAPVSRAAPPPRGGPQIIGFFPEAGG